MDRLHWSDDRMDDFAAMVDRRFRRVEDMPDRLTRLEGEVAGIRSDSHECNENVKQLQSLFSQRIKERELERKEREKDRKSDRRWWVGTVFTAAALVIAAVGLLGPNI